MGAGGQLMARLSITYRTERPTDSVSLGAFSQIAAKRRFGLEALKSDDPETGLFAAFVELVGPAAAKDVDAFDAWLFTVESFELEAEADPSDPSPAETSSSETSPDSPPTSD